jgi:hypothetical protein
MYRVLSTLPRDLGAMRTNDAHPRSHITLNKNKHEVMQLRIDLFLFEEIYTALIAQVSAFFRTSSTLHPHSADSLYDEDQLRSSRSLEYKIHRPGDGIRDRSSDPEKNLGARSRSTRAA